ncbi:MAG: two-component system response regulator [Flavobacteriales bacterium TMED123]|nr:MAG: two-component system response regulator [Flavobacteriales bacterium TMED123]|tara:strand:+ start:1817 stop:3361 length:1545 start_codon:yes stop_codon:yes gene_type:complete
MINILWADDEIDILKPHIIFLEQKGYSVVTAKSGDEALDRFNESAFDLVFLDENMPGYTGLETLVKMKAMRPNIPIVMITKSEEESIMEEAIGSKISDYLIKPVNPNQILLTIKKNIDSKRLVGERTTMNYQHEFRNIGMRLSQNLSKEDWVEIFKELTFWELEIEKSGEESVEEILAMQKQEANTQFFRFVKEHYKSWINGLDAPLLSHNLIRNNVIPHLVDNTPLYFVLIDNLRYDQWKIIEPMLINDFRIKKEQIYYSILPTATQYSRNAIFSGLLPAEMEKRFPGKWKNDEDEGGKNMYEKEFLTDQLQRLGKGDCKMSYSKITNIDFGKKVANQIPNMRHNNLNVIVYNFVDMLSHARTDMKVIKELAEDDSAYRSLTASWFEHSPLKDIIKEIAKQGAKMIITTDHGTISVKRPSKVIGDRNVNANLRYKQGKNLNYIKSDVLEIEKPAEYHLPQQNISSKYVFAKEDMYFVYQNNYNQFAQYYKDTFQHGGVSLEEMLIPFVLLEAK